MGFARESMDENAPAAAARILCAGRISEPVGEGLRGTLLFFGRISVSQSYDSLKRIIDGFGVRRCYWGSDLTRLPAHCSYRQAVTMFTEELPFLSRGDLDWVMGRALLERLNWSRRREPRMIAVIFEVWPKTDRKGDYFDIAATLNPTWKKSTASSRRTLCQPVRRGKNPLALLLAR